MVTSHTLHTSDVLFTIFRSRTLRLARLSVFRKQADAICRFRPPCYSQTSPRYPLATRLGGPNSILDLMQMEQDGQRNNAACSPTSRLRYTRTYLVHRRMLLLWQQCVPLASLRCVSLSKMPLRRFLTLILLTWRIW
jgi:hypothetical protein